MLFGMAEQATKNISPQFLGAFCAEILKHIEKSAVLMSDENPENAEQLKEYFQKNWKEIVCNCLDFSRDMIEFFADEKTKDAQNDFVELFNIKQSLK